MFNNDLYTIHKTDFSYEQKNRFTFTYNVNPALHFYPQGQIFLFYPFLKKREIFMIKKVQND